MRIDSADFQHRFRSDGTAFEQVVHDLIRALARGAGVGSQRVHWDFRTNTADGGRDLVVDVGHPSGSDQFIPNAPSLWSLKSGQAGTRPSELRAEITAGNHPEVRAALRRGHVYVWCSAGPASLDQRTKMTTEASAIAAELGVSPDLIAFRWQDAIVAEINRHPGLIARHMPEIMAQRGELQTLNQWRRELGMRTEWADFGGRDGVVSRVAAHLLACEGPNVLHVAGLSGIGKTRTVFQACLREDDLAGVFYLSRNSDFTKELYRYLEDNDSVVQFVVDEVRLEDLEYIASRLSKFAARVRVVTVGPAARQRHRAAGNILILPEPADADEVLRVISGLGAGLSSEVLRSIAEQSRHDLRLAIKLTEASHRTPELRDRPVIDVDDIWNRLMALFGSEAGDPAKFRDYYEVLTTSVDVGLEGEFGGELAALAGHFEHPVEHLRAVALQAVNCGLGIRAARFFEATPHALAVRLFEERVWPRIADRLDEFFAGLSARHQRRFIERCQACSGHYGAEVQARLGDYFLGVMNEIGLAALSPRDPSRVFQAWVEFDPARGLAWLRRAVERAAADELRGIDGRTDGSGGWRGRRQLVWLCQNLAAFGEHFADCEAVLFRLALHETEPEIGNNGTAVWQHLFWPALSGSELPFKPPPADPAQAPGGGHS